MELLVASLILPAAVAARVWPEDIDDGYVPAPNIEAEAGDPQTMTGYLLTDAAKLDGALCLDGTPGLYYHRKGTGSGANKWYIHQEGGGWCSSVDSCRSRSLSLLGSSLNYTSTISMMDYEYFSLDPAINPLMYNWNSVYFKYCDGGSFSGSNASATTIGGGKQLHFRGKHILNGGITDMLQHRGLATAAEVVVSGCSAGGLATFLHCEHWAERIRAEGLASAKVVCMPDSGLFRDYQGCTTPGVCDPPHYHDRLVWVFDWMNATSGVNDACIASETPTSNCMFAEHTMKYLTTPTFALQGEYDSWQVLADLGIVGGQMMPNQTTPAQVALVNEYGVNFTAIVHANLLSSPQHSIFLDSCFHHCGGWGEYPVGPDEVTQPFAMQEWYDAIGKGALSKPNEQKTWIQGKPFPCLECCYV